MSYTSPDRPGDPPIPDYRWESIPDPGKYGSTAGCYGCAFRKMPEIRCSRIPCHVGPRRNMVAVLINPEVKTA